MPSVHDQIVTNANMTNAMKQAQKEPRMSGSSIDSKEFLFLLTQQLQYQDPMNPMDNTDMLAQEAQFATLEQMENLTDSFSKFSNMYQANSLLGQTVGVVVDGKETIGKVEFADYSDTSGASISVNGKMFPLDSIVKIYPENANNDNSSNNSENKPQTEKKEGLMDKAVDLVSHNASKIGDAIQNYKKSGVEIAKPTINAKI